MYPNMYSMNNMYGMNNIPNLNNTNSYPYQNTYQQKENINWINVNGIQGAKDVQIQANQTAWLMDMNQPVFYVKKADNMGVCTLEAYKFEKINPEQPVTLKEQNFVTKEEFEQFKAQLLQPKEVVNESVNK